MHSKKCLGSRKMAESKVVVFNDDNYFGHCPFEEHDNYYLNIGRGHWMVCDKCKMKWFIGANLFCSWKGQDEAIWRANAEKITKYTEVDWFFLISFWKRYWTWRWKKCTKKIGPQKPTIIEPTLPAINGQRPGGPPTGSGIISSAHPALDAGNRLDDMKTSTNLYSVLSVGRFFSLKLFLRAIHAGRTLLTNQSRWFLKALNSLQAYSLAP